MDLPSAWSDEAQLLAHVIDQAVIANWYQTKDAQRGRNKPKPMRRPGVKPGDDGSIRYGTKQADPAAARAFLASIGPDRSEEQPQDAGDDELGERNGEVDADDDPDA